MPDLVVEVVTPEKALLVGPATAIMLRSSDGELTILAGHTPLVTDVVPGLVRVDQEDGEIRLAVHGGYLFVDSGPGAAEQDDTTPPSTDPPAADGAAAGGGAVSTKVRLLAGIAEKAGDVDVPRAERAREEASSRVEQLRAGRPDAGRGEGGADHGAAGDAELIEAEAALQRAEVRLSVAQGENARSGS